jgi:nitrite reductase/ring-hydroxylating ferredoxin subunit
MSNEVKSVAAMNETNKAWVRVCALNHVPTNKAIDLNINGQRLIIARCGDEARVFQGFCTHMLFPLGGSNVEDCVMTCGLHHSRFDVRDGSVVDWSTFPPLVGRALAAIRERKALRRYETRVTDGDVYILWPTNNPATVRIRV